MNLYNAKKEPHFIEAYQKHFAGLNPKRVLEIGVQNGGSLKIWRDMFPRAEIVGIDIDEECTRQRDTNIEVRIGDQTDEKFLESLGEFDIIIDDGGHKMSQQQISFNLLMPKLREGGIYIIEDTHTSYWEGFLDLRITTVEMIKGLIDDIHEYADVYKDGVPTRSIVKKGLSNKYQVKSIAVYPGITFIFK